MGKFHDQSFPNETAEYRSARDALLAEEMELRSQVEKVAALRRALPLGGRVDEDYEFKGVDGKSVRMSELFTDASSGLLVYSFMYKTGGNACPACTSLLDFLDGGAPHIKSKLNFAVVAKADAGQLKNWADSRGWSNLPLLSSAGTTYNLDYKAEDGDENQWPLINVFKKTNDGIFHTWASELFYANSEDGQHTRHADQIWPLWNVFDLSPEGRPQDWFPAYSYD